MKPFLLMVGMHRSGTSFLARAFNLRGIFLGNSQDLVSDDWRSFDDNLRGHWEHKKILELNEAILENSGGSWDDIPTEIHSNEKITHDIQQFLDELQNYHSLGAGIKDPRFLICFDLWLNHLPKDFLIVGIYRDPLKVAESLKKRNGFDYEKSIKLWKTYNQKLLQLLDSHKGFLLNFDWKQEKILREIDLICEKLGLSTNLKLDEWYTPSLLHSNQNYDSNYSLDDETKKIFSQLNELSSQNDKILIEKTTHSEKELLDIIFNNLIQMQKQGNTFKEINDENLKKIKNLNLEKSNLKLEITNLQNALKKIQQSTTWKSLRKIDEVKKKLKKS